MDQHQMKSGESVIKQTDGTWAVMVATPAGWVTGDQLAKIAELVREGTGTAKFGSGQRIIILTSRDRLESVREGLAAVGLSAGPGGETVRNVKGCFGKLCKYSVQDGGGDALALDNVFAGRQVPAALKIAVSGCMKNCMEAQSSDIGLIGMPDGYHVYVGGRGGRRQVLGQLVRENVQPGELPSVVEELIARYTGAAKWRERVSHVVDKQGIEVFK